MYKVAVLASTNGTNFQSLLDAKEIGILRNNVEITCLITNKADCGAVEKANKAGIPVYVIDADSKTREVFDAEVLAILHEHKINLVVLGGFMRIVSPLLVNEYKNRIINVHPSLLPKYGGGMNLSVHKSAIDAGETETGMTIHLLDEGIDTGPIILQKSCPIEPEDTPESLKDRVQALEIEWYPKVVQMFADGKIEVINNEVKINE